MSGRPSAVFFGFTHCPEVCPTTLGDIARWFDELGAEAGDLQVYFLTVDPERDSAQVLGDYVSRVPGVSGVTGSRAETDKAIRAFRVIARKVPLEGGDYTMDHTASVMLFDRQGNFVQIVRCQEPLATAIPKLRALTRKGGA